MDGMEQMVDDGYLDCPVCGGRARPRFPSAGTVRVRLPRCRLRPLRDGALLRPDLPRAIHRPARRAA